MKKAIHGADKQATGQIPAGRYWFGCFFALFIVIGLIYIRYPLNNIAIVMGDGTSSVLIPEWFSRQYASGHLPLWSRESAAGIPIAAHMLGAFFFPPILFARLPMVWFVWLNYCFSVSFGACFFGCYLEQLKVKRWVATIMAFVLLLSIYYGGLRKFHVAIIECISLYPFTFYQFQRYVNTGKRNAIVLAGMGTGTMLLVATPSIQYAMYMMIALFALVLTQCIQRKEKAGKLAVDACIYLVVTGCIAAVQVLPGYALMQRYAAMSNKTKVSYETFKSYSIHPMKLVMMLFPNVFSNIYNAFGIMHSSEMDIELFMGTLMTAVLVFGIIHYRKDQRVRLLTLIALGTFLYAASGNIPLLSKVLYRIPMLNNVRCPSRALFLFVMLELTIVAVTLSRVSDGGDELKAFGRFLPRYCAFAVLVLEFIYLPPFRDQLLATGEINMNGASVAFKGLIPIIALAVCVNVFIWLSREEAPERRKRLLPVCVVVIVAVASIVECLPYSRMTFAEPVSDYEFSEDFRKIKEEAGNHSIITTHASYNGGNASQSADHNRQFYTGVSSLNTYLTFNNPDLYFISGQSRSADFVYYNFSGLQTGYSTIKKLLQQNDVLSMLGVKYIEDTKGMLFRNFPVVDKSAPAEPVMTEPEEVELPSCEGEYVSKEYPVPIEPHGWYRVSFDAHTEATPELFYADFFGFENDVYYDNAEQQVNFTLEPGEHTYTAYLYSGMDRIPENVALRLIAINEVPIAVRNLKLEKMNIDVSVYVPLSEVDSDYDSQPSQRLPEPQTELFWVNNRAKDLFYPANHVRSIIDLNEIAICPASYDFTRTSYIENGVDKDYDENGAVISDVRWVSNSEVQATVECDEDAFINFAQCYDPDWHVYVDGNETDNYQTNLILQGFNVTRGRHEIVYRYQPKLVYLGLGMTLGAVLGCVLYLVLSNLRKREKQ